ncbi:MAG: HAMP domain-containing histidine kinase [Clostridia bacterium]|nr:HAMP domain-containing histidine kinase [Clostridia bacterium]
MKRNLVYLKKYLPWLCLLLCIDIVLILILWLADVQALRALSAVILVGTVTLFFLIGVVLIRQSQRREELFYNFIENPEEQNEEMLIRQLSEAEGYAMRQLGNLLRDERNHYNQLLAREIDYEEYVESWAHEIKTPISLLTLLLDNRRKEIPENVALKLDYTRNRMQEYVNQMLYYARLKGTQKDYLFEKISLKACVDEVLDDYRPLFEEKNVSVEEKMADFYVYTDQRSISFIISQITSNAIKYTDETRQPKIEISCEQNQKAVILSIRDNGIGIREMDLPYVWEKGVTGDSGIDRKKATGMGLYLVEGIAKHLKISLELTSKWGEGTEMKLKFPIV